MLQRTTLAATLCSVLTVGCAMGCGERVAAQPNPPAGAGPDGTASSTKEQVAVANDLQLMIQAALADASRRASPGAPVPALIRAEKVIWPDGSLGCPMPGRAYTMALVPGYRIRFRSGTTELDYHAAEHGLPFLCPSGRAAEPAANTQIY